ncbi:hypothetical protein BOH78_2577 [Pichia kudriavzevii]|nr:hypothetical protein BOH78_5479 [Pichia kudriavzevii]ONH70261.1 hypothetical protein BOH78_5371 [Pichia kudriavzevii]ONH70313.1 hypothetical protein BOH78_5317 [Pichia kudriavzevii]ONH70436.1 hypothetical protein BOH78_5068 [Pichia kudriavzevii]ONH70554.1 hypothetical protein BOH78_5137 [Pichia kudriavzevii]
MFSTSDSVLIII